MYHALRMSQPVCRYPRRRARRRDIASPCVSTYCRPRFGRSDVLAVLGFGAHARARSSAFFPRASRTAMRMRRVSKSGARTVKCARTRRRRAVDERRHLFHGGRRTRRGRKRRDRRSGATSRMRGSSRGCARARRRISCASGIISTRSTKAKATKNAIASSAADARPGSARRLPDNYPAASAIGLRDAPQARAGLLRSRRAPRARRSRIRGSGARGAIRASTARRRRASRAACVRRRIVHNYTFPERRRWSVTPRITLTTSTRKSTRR